MSNSALAKEVVRNVVHLIDKHGTNKRTVAIGAGMPVETFNRRISGTSTTPFNLDEVQAIAAHFQVSIHSIVPNEVTS